MENREAVKIIESEQPLIGLMQHFGSGLTAFQFYATHAASVYAKTNAGTLCCSCKMNSVSRIQTYHWRTAVNPKFAFGWRDLIRLSHFGWLRLGSLAIHQTAVEFSTSHGFCESCALKTKLNRLGSNIVKFISFFLLIVCFGMMIVGGGGLLFMREELKETAAFVVCLLVGILGLATSIYGHIWERKLKIPTPLRAIGRKPFYLEKVTSMSAFP